MKGNQVDEIKGADPAALEAKVNQHKCDPVDSFAGKMVTLGGSTVSAGPAVDPREARLRFMGLTVDQKSTENLKVAGETAAGGTDKIMSIEIFDMLKNSETLTLHSNSSTLVTIFFGMIHRFVSRL